MDMLYFIRSNKKVEHWGSVMFNCYFLHIDTLRGIGSLTPMLDRLPESLRSGFQLRPESPEMRRSLLGACLCSYALAKRIGVCAKELTFIDNGHGKPLLRDYPKTHFSISHSGTFVVCAVGSKPVGIDIEDISRLGARRKNLEGIASRFFRTDEQVYVASKGSSDEKTNAFFEIWTKKEAYIKREGLGLALSLKSFSVFNLPDTWFYRVKTGFMTVCHAAVPLSEQPPGAADPSHGADAACKSIRVTLTPGGEFVVSDGLNID